MKKEIHRHKKQPINKKMRDFHGTERWEKDVKSDEKPSSTQTHSNYRELLIKKYRSKFPRKTPVLLEKTSTIRL